jgi:hypothetical protein
MGKLPIKEFLKPDWRKIVLTIIIFLILINVQIFPGKIISMPGTEVIIYVSLLSELEHTYYGSYKRIFESIGLIVIFLFISYFLSCLIVWIYDRVKKK